MNLHDKTYLDMMAHVMSQGDYVPNRTGVDTLSDLGYMAKYDLEKGFPVLTTKRVAWKWAIAEMLWFLSGNCDDIAGLVQKDRQGKTVDARPVWSKWADDNGKLGPIYGVNWRNWYGPERHTTADCTRHIDQIEASISMLKNSPDSRRNIVTSWQPTDIEDQALPPCHVLFKLTARNGKLHCLMWQRSLDIPIGGPFNIVQYAALVHMIAKLVGLRPGVLTHQIDDAHIYVDQLDGCREQMNRPMYNPSPKLIIHGAHETIEDFKLGDFELYNYNHEGKIDFPVAV